MPTLYGFFKYDTFPYCTHSPGELVEKSGGFRAKSYQGTFARSSVIMVLPLRIGAETGAALEELEREYGHMQAALLASYKEKALKILPELANTTPYQAK